MVVVDVIFLFWMSLLLFCANIRVTANIVLWWWWDRCRRGVRHRSALVHYRYQATALASLTGIGGGG